jgi:hypothetical protein
MTDGTPSDEFYHSDNHKHMDYVQAVIARLANNSFLMKGWALTISSATLGFAVTQKHFGLAPAALVPATHSGRSTLATCASSRGPALLLGALCYS